MIHRLLAVLALVFLVQPASAFWEVGHATVAQIAWANVKPATKVQIRRLLAREALLQTPECPVATIEQASYWADCIKPLKGADGKGRFDYAYNWHFQNVNVCKPFDLSGACKDGNCVSAQIARDVAVLKGRTASDTERLKALLFLVHFVGDLHQPLHAGDRGDRGGNDVKASYGIYGPDKFGLHQIWDGPLAERAMSTPPRLIRRYPAADRRRFAGGTIDEWSRESWQVSHDTVYSSALGGDPCGPVPPVARLDDATIARIEPVMHLQLQRGGLRLARLLDEAFGQGSA